MMCKRCGGSGLEPDHKAIGQQMRVLRHKAEMTLDDLATLMHYSKVYLSDLELGRRQWNDRLQRMYQQWCKR
jgi:transcriptional regulator with XRE-family HTH domain